MYTLMVKGHFDAAHQLPNYDGPCKNMHGHTWKVIAAFNYEKLYVDKKHPRFGMAQDFKVLKTQLKTILAKFDHTDCKWFDCKPPTAENIANYIYDAIHSMNNHLKWVEVWESEDAGARYEPERE